MKDRVLIDGYWARSARISGWERYSKTLVDELLRDGRGLDVTVAVPPERSHRLGWEQVALPLRARKFAGLCHLTAAPPSPFANGRRTVVTVHDTTFAINASWMSRAGRWYYRPGLRRVLASESWILTPSESAKADLLNMGVAESRVMAAPLGIHLPPIRELSSLGSHYILYVGTREPRKDLATLIRAWAKVQPPGWQLMLAGRAGWGASIDSEMPGVCVAGEVDDVELDVLVRNAEAVVMPSLYEGFGLPVLEAMARGTAVVATDIAAHREVGGDVPIFFSVGDSATLAEIIAELVGRSLALNGRRTAGIERARLFSAERFADSVALAYKRILEQS